MRISPSVCDSVGEGFNVQLRKIALRPLKSRSVSRAVVVLAMDVSGIA
jgi:hypothetical protein